MAAPHSYRPVGLATRPPRDRRPVRHAVRRSALQPPPQRPFHSARQDSYRPHRSPPGSIRPSAFVPDRVADRAVASDPCL